MHFETIIIDFDSTIVQVESLEDLAAIALADCDDMKERVEAIAAITNEAMDGKIGFREALARRVPLLCAQQRHLDELVRILQKKITPSLLENRDWFHANSDRLYVVSGGFREFILPVVLPLGFREDHVFANTFTVDESGMITGADSTNFLSQDDGKTLLLRALNLPKPRLIVGDGYSDYQLKASGEADTFYVLTENVQRESVIRLADRVLPTFDELVQ
jgi:D-3-phosphoglycerate dehydrogenase / 2-oxoglutarate reductase